MIWVSDFCCCWTCEILVSLAIQQNKNPSLYWLMLCFQHPCLRYRLVFVAQFATWQRCIVNCTLFYQYLIVQRIDVVKPIEVVICFLRTYTSGASVLALLTKTGLCRSVMASVIHMEPVSSDFSSLYLITTWWMSVSLKPSNVSSALQPNSGCTAWEVKAYGNLTDIMNAAITPIFYTWVRSYQALYFVSYPKAH